MTNDEWRMTNDKWHFFRNKAEQIDMKTIARPEKADRTYAT
jgi:hypothetical protein